MALPPAPALSGTPDSKVNGASAPLLEGCARLSGLFFLAAAVYVSKFHLQSFLFFGSSSPTGNNQIVLKRGGRCGDPWAMPPNWAPISPAELAARSAEVRRTKASKIVDLRLKQIEHRNRKASFRPPFPPPPPGRDFNLPRRMKTKPPQA